MQPLIRFVYRSTATLFAQVSLLARVLAVLSPNFFLFYQGDALVSTPQTEGQLLIRVAVAIALTVLFCLYFFWDVLIVAGGGSHKDLWATSQDWEKTKASMKNSDPSVMGSSAWMEDRARR